MVLRCYVNGLQTTSIGQGYIRLSCSPYVDGGCVDWLFCPNAQSTSGLKSMGVTNGRETGVSLIDTQNMRLS